MKASDFLEGVNKDIQTLVTPLSLAAWGAQTTGEKHWVDELTAAEIKLNHFFSDRDRFNRMKELLKGDHHISELERRQLTLLVNEMESKQLPKDMLEEKAKASAELNHLYNTYSPERDGKTYMPNDIRSILSESKDEKERENAWKASKQVGKVVSSKLLELVRLRNESARVLGYNDYYEMAFKGQELDCNEIFSMFHQFLIDTDSAFQEWKRELDEELAAKFGTTISELKPWHYEDPFFQKAPSTDQLDLTHLFKSQDVTDLTIKTFELLGMDIQDILEKSDLEPRKGKNPTAFCMNVNREGDVRVLCNIAPSHYWMGTMLHEFAHATYDKLVDTQLPYVLRTPSHILTTEAMAMMFGRMVENPEWLEKVLNLDKAAIAHMKPALQKYQLFTSLIAARFIITFVFFERELYKNPEQDLNQLWWKLVEEIQHIKAPEDRVKEPDWAAKIHFTLAPVYYQNYLLGEFMAYQIHDFIKEYISDEFFHERVGHYLTQKVYRPGAFYSWNDLLIKLTGESLQYHSFIKEIKLLPSKR